MKHSLFLALFLCAAITLNANAQTKEEISKFKSEVESDLTGNILPFWMDKVTDPAGGFYGTVVNDGTAFPQAPKSAVMNARVLWAFSKAFGKYGLDCYRETADRAADYYISHFIDKEFGGTVWSVTPEGEIKDGTKQSYASAFGIYGLAEHFRATGSQASLDAAIALFRTLEEHSYDKVNGGYFETFNQDWTTPGPRTAGLRPVATKTMNTQINMMKAYSTLYQVWPDETLRGRIVELMDIFRTKLYDPEGKHLLVNCDDNWNSLEDIHYFGHDIEAAWLLWETADVLKDEDLKMNIRQQVLDLTDEALASGLTAEGAMQDERTSRGIRARYSWWSQCETMIGCINAWQITGESRYFDTAEKNWEFVKSWFIDRENGGWFKTINKDCQPAREPKANEWHGPYHNSHFAFEVIERL